MSKPLKVDPTAQEPYESPSHIERNIRSVASMHQQALAERSYSIRIADWVNRKASQMSFVLFHAVWFSTWMWINRGPATSAPFDAFPFPLLTLIVSLEAIFLSLFLLMSQSRANRQADQRAHLDLQVNLLAEHEMTKVLTMLEALCRAKGLVEAEDPELPELKKQTEPEAMIRDLNQALPDKS